MKVYIHKGLFALLCTALFGFSHPLFAQRHLRIEGGMDTSSISIKIIQGKSTARIIIESGIKLAYTTNMEKEIPYLTHGENLRLRTHVDTLYFFPTPYDNVRKLTLSADKYFDETIGPLRLYPKSTYKFKVYDKERPKRGYDIPFTVQKIYFGVHAGAVTLLNQGAIGARAEATLSVKLTEGLYASPAMAYNFLSLSPGITRQFVETSVSLKVCPGEKWHFGAGYVYAFLDYSDSGFTAQCTRVLKSDLYLRGQFIYYFADQNPVLGISIGIHL